MGMFDWVDVGGPDPIPCPDCGKDLEGWQTKDTGCTLTTVPWYSASCFYTSCDGCKAWVQYTRDEVVVRPRFYGYTMESKARTLLKGDQDGSG